MVLNRHVDIMFPDFRPSNGSDKPTPHGWSPAVRQLPRGHGKVGQLFPTYRAAGKQPRGQHGGVCTRRRIAEHEKHESEARNEPLCK